MPPSSSEFRESCSVAPRSCAARSSSPNLATELVEARPPRETSRPQHDLRCADRPGIDVAERLRPFGERPFLEPIEGTEPAAGDRVERLAEFERRVAVGAGEHDFLQ